MSYLAPRYTTTNPQTGIDLPVVDWRALPIDQDWNAIADQPQPFGLRGNNLELDVGLYDAQDNLRLGRVDGSPTLSIKGQGREQSMIRARRDLGPDAFLIGGGSKLKGAKSHYADIGITGPSARDLALGVPPCQMSGIQAPGGETVISRVQASYLRRGIVISSDHDYLEFIKCVSCWAGLAYGLDARQEASHYIGVAQLTENRRCGVHVARSNVMGGQEVHSMHVGHEPNGIEGEPLLGAPDYYEDNDKVLSGARFTNLMVEGVGNAFIYAPGTRNPDGSYINNPDGYWGRRVLGNDFGELDFIPYLTSYALPLDMGIAGVNQAFIVCSRFEDNNFGSTSWLAYPPPGTGPYIICDTASNNTVIARNIAGALRDNRSIFAPADGRRTPQTSYSMSFTDTATGHFGRLTKVTAPTVKRCQIMQLGPQGRGVVPHQGTGAPVYGTMGQAGTKDDFLVCWTRKPYVAPIPVLSYDTSIQGGAPVKPDPSGTGGVVACTATDPLRVGDAMASVSNKGEVPVTYV